MKRLLGALAIAVTGLAACAPPTQDLATLALRSEEAAHAATVATPGSVRAGPGARVDRLLPASASRADREGPQGARPTAADRFGGLAIAGGEIFVSGEHQVDRLVEGSADPIVELDAKSASDAPPLALAASPGGALYAVSPERGELFRIDLRTRSSARIASGLAHPSAAVALADGSLAVLEAAAGRLTLVETDGKLTALASNLSSPVGLAHHAGRFLVTEVGGGRILALGAGRPPLPVASGFSIPVGVAVDRAGRLVVADAATGSIYRVESDASRSELVAGLDLRRVIAGQPVAVPLAFDDSGALLMVAPGDGSLWRITPP